MKIVTSLLFLVVGAVTMLGFIEAGRADTPTPVQLAQAGSSSSAVTVPPFEPPSSAAPADAGSAATPAPAAKPADQLPNPVDDPLAAIETFKAQKKQGWAAGILAAVVMLTMGFSRAAAKWPTSRLFAWFAKNKTAIYIVSGLGVTSAAAFNAIALGGTWMAAVWSAVAAFFTMADPGKKPA
jgi:hypothetical protein